MANEHDQDGVLPDTTHMAWTLRKAEFDLIDGLELLAKQGLLTDEPWTVKSFAKRQSPMSSKERMARMREQKQKQEHYDTVTGRNTELKIELEKELEPETGELTQTLWRKLWTTLWTEAKLPIDSGMNPKQNELVLQWVEADIEPEDVKNAIAYNLENGLPVVRPQSINTGVYTERNKRMSKPKSTADKLREQGYQVDD